MAMAGQRRLLQLIIFVLPAHALLHQIKNENENEDDRFYANMESQRYYGGYQIARKIYSKQH
jgi:hypothetical protein